MPKQLYKPSAFAQSPQEFAKARSQTLGMQRRRFGADQDSRLAL